MSPVSVTTTSDAEKITTKPTTNQLPESRVNGCITIKHDAIKMPQTSADRVMHL
jgi:hypothetical protein